MNIKKGDYVRVIMCCYPTPNQYFLGKVSLVGDVFDNYVNLSRWDINLGYNFVEKVDINSIDIEMELNEMQYSKYKEFLTELSKTLFSELIYKSCQN